MTKLVRFASNQTQSAESWGVKVEEGVRDIGCLLGSTPTLSDAIREWSSISGNLDKLLADAPLVADDVKILCPVNDGGKVICIGLNYRDHAIETGAEIPLSRLSLAS